MCHRLGVSVVSATAMSQRSGSGVCSLAGKSLVPESVRVNIAKCRRLVSSSLPVHLD